MLQRTLSGKALYLESVTRLRQKLQARVPFKERVRRGEAQYGHALFEDIYREDHVKFLNELADDPRMHPVFKLLLNCPPDVADFLLMRVLDYGTAASQLAVRRRAADMDLENIKNVREAVAALREVSSAFVCDTQELQMTVAKACPELFDCLNRVDAFLGECEREIEQKKRGMPRKFWGRAAARTQFICNTASCFEHTVGKPHYEAVAALANVLFDTDQTSAETVRSAYRKYRPIRNPTNR
jgi:hypothetical protein